MLEFQELLLSDKLEHPIEYIPSEPELCPQHFWTIVLYSQNLLGHTTHCVYPHVPARQPLARQQYQINVSIISDPKCFASFTPCMRSCQLDSITWRSWYTQNNHLEESHNINISAKCKRTPHSSYTLSVSKRQYGRIRFRRQIGAGAPVVLQI